MDEFVPREFDVPRRLERPQFMLEPLGPDHNDQDYDAWNVLALAPDLSLGGYVAGQCVGSAIYDAAHTYVPPVVLGAVGQIAGAEVAVQLALIWITHIGIDRALGYGLKYPTSFKETHLQRAGWANDDADSIPSITAVNPQAMPTD